MQPRPLRTTVIGSYPFPAWLEFACAHLDQFGADDLAELQDDAVICALHDQLAAGLDVITDGEQTRLDFNLSFYGYLEGIELEGAPPRRFGPARARPARQARASPANSARRAASASSRNSSASSGSPSPQSAVAISDQRSRRASPAPTRSAAACCRTSSTPIATRSPRRCCRSCAPNSRRSSPPAAARSRVDEPSMSCYAHRRTRGASSTSSIAPSSRSSASAASPPISASATTRAAPSASAATRRCFPAFLDFTLDEIHVEMASREFAEIEIIGEIAKRRDVAVGIIDVKSYYIETPDDIAERVRLCLQHAPADRLAFAPDCGLTPDRPLGGEAEARRTWSPASNSSANSRAFRVFSNKRVCSTRRVDRH